MIRVLTLYFPNLRNSSHTHLMTHPAIKPSHPYIYCVTEVSLRHCMSYIAKGPEQCKPLNDRIDWHYPRCASNQAELEEL